MIDPNISDYFQQFSVSYHIAYIAQNWFSKQKGDFSLFCWPPQSPDLNPMPFLDEVERAFRHLDLQSSNLGKLYSSSKASDFVFDLLVSLIQSKKNQGFIKGNENHGNSSRLVDDDPDGGMAKRPGKVEETCTHGYFPLLPEFLHGVPATVHQNVWIIHDDTPTHFSIAVLTTSILHILGGGLDAADLLLGLGAPRISIP
ncbi:hypothetical protein TNCV_2103171 [Trichonephila clavipes]|nr:hypothetical protein TNCV_2103171 [Trichonephila clavipes]